MVKNNIVGSTTAIVVAFIIGIVVGIGIVYVYQLINGIPVHVDTCICKDIGGTITWESEKGVVKCPPPNYEKYTTMCPQPE